MPTPSRFVQIHYLTSYPASLLNRDDVGFAKRITFGGAPRIRVSSQCLKRHWRRHTGEHGLVSIGKPMSVRSRQTFEQLVVAPLLQEGVGEELARAVTAAIMGLMLGTKEKKEADEGEAPAQGKKARAGKAGKAAKGEADAGKTEAPEPGESKLQTEQVTVLGRPEVAFLLEEARDLCKQVTDPKKAAEAAKKHFTKERQENLRALPIGSGLDAVLFGRMVTSDILARRDAAVHVAHAFTVHEEEVEPDYFSAVDELLDGGGQGSGHIGSTELTSGLFYGYVVVDVPLLVANLTGQPAVDWQKADRRLAAEVVEHLVHTIATVSPGAKKGSTAPYAAAHLVLAECGPAQPRTLANAFIDPVRAREKGLIQGAYEALAGYVKDVDRMYDLKLARQVAAIGLKDEHRAILGQVGSLGAIAKFCAAQVQA